MDVRNMARKKEKTDEEHPLPKTHFKLQQADVERMLAANVQIGSLFVNSQMKAYTAKKENGSEFQRKIFNLQHTWTKIRVAAMAICAIKNPKDVIAIASDVKAQRGVLKFAYRTRCRAIAGRFSPGTFTNPRQKGFTEPMLIIIADPRVDHQAISESAKVNLPVIAFCNSDTPLAFVDIVIPCNTAGVLSIGLMWWMLAREVLRKRGSIRQAPAGEVDNEPWGVKPDTFIYRDPAQEEKDNQEAWGWMTEQPLSEAPMEKWTVMIDVGVTEQSWGHSFIFSVPDQAAAPQQEAQAPPKSGTSPPVEGEEDWGAPLRQSRLPRQSPRRGPRCPPSPKSVGRGTDQSAGWKKRAVRDAVSEEGFEVFRESYI